MRVVKRFISVMMLSMMIVSLAGIDTYAHTNCIKLRTFKEYTHQQGNYKISIDKKSLSKDSLGNLSLHLGKASDLLLSAENVYDVICSSEKIFYMQVTGRENGTMTPSALMAYELKTRTAKKIKDFDTYAHLEYIQGDSAYLRVPDKNSGKESFHLLDMKTGNQKEIIKSSANSDLVAIEADRKNIFYTRFRFDSATDVLAVTDLNGQNEKELARGIIAFKVTPSKIYYLSKDENEKKFLYEVDKNGQNKKLISNASDSLVGFFEEVSTDREAFVLENFDPLSGDGEFVYYKLYYKTGKIQKISKPSVYVKALN